MTDDTAKQAASRVLDRIERDQAIHRDSVEEEIRRAYREASGAQEMAPARAARSGCIFETQDHPDKPWKSTTYCRVHQSFTC